MSTDPVLVSNMRVCVVGAGPAGLAAARELIKEGHSVVVMEQNHDVGGQWLYVDPELQAAHQVPNGVNADDAIGRVLQEYQPSKRVIHSSIYASLRLMLPRDIIGFTDFPFIAKEGRDARMFPGHRELHLYLRDFCDWFGLRELIRFNTRVVYVSMDDMISSSSSPSVKMNAQSSGRDHHQNSWVVRTMDQNNDSENLVEELFDAVVIAAGHYSQPRIPNINGSNSWRRKQLHSHVYRVPEPFRNEVVVVVGISYSGREISLELVKVAKEVHLSAKSLQISPSLSAMIAKYHNLHLHLQIKTLFEDGRVLFDDGSSVVADSIIYCTGYSYSFPFLDTKDIVSIDDGRVGPLYEHTFPPSLAPYLSFVGIPMKITAFRFFESQAKWIAQVLSGKRKLPSYDDMMNAIEEFYRSRDVKGIPKDKTHDIANFEYCDKYGDYCDFPHLENWKKEQYMAAIQDAETNLETYRDRWDEDEAYQSHHFMQMYDPEVINSV